MVADLREMQENQGFSENRIDKSRFVDERRHDWMKNKDMLAFFIVHY